MTARRRRRSQPHKRKTPPDRDDFDARFRRELVDDFGIWELCGRWDCWRARACRDPGVTCFDEHREIVQDLIVDRAWAACKLAGIGRDDLFDALPEEGW